MRLVVLAAKYVWTLRIASKWVRMERSWKAGHREEESPKPTKLEGTEGLTSSYQSWEAVKRHPGSSSGCRHTVGDCWLTPSSPKRCGDLGYLGVHLEMGP